MSITYTPTTPFGSKDGLPANDPNKVIKGAEFTTEFTAIQSAFNLAAPTAAPVFTGTATFDAVTVTGDLAVDTDTLFVDASTNRVGIGTDAPTNSLVVSDGDDGIEIRTSLTDDNRILSYNRTTAAYTKMSFDAADYDFRVDGGAPSVSINASGSVGIGTSDPSGVGGGGDLAVIGSGGARLVLNNSSRNWAIRGDSGVDDLRIAARGAGDTADIDIVTMTTGGNVGIGTDSPDSKFVVSNGAAASGVEFIPATGSTSLVSIERSSNAFEPFRYRALDHRFETGASQSEAMRIDDSGNVGIGQTLPNYSVDVKASGGAFTAINIEAPDDTGFSHLFFSDSANAVGRISYDHTSDSLSFRTNGSNVLNIDSSGNVGIGEASPTFKVQQSETAGGAFAFGGSGFSFDSTTIPNYGLSHTRPAGEFNTVLSGFSNVKFAVNQQERMRIDANGNVGIGTDSPDAPLHVNGGAIMGGDGTAPTQGWNTGLRGTTEQTTANLSTTGTLSSSLWAVESTGNVAGSGGGVLFGAREGRFAAIKGLLVSGSNNTSGDLSFSTRRANTDSTLTEAMRIDASGNVGIGTASPSAVLQTNVASGSNEFRQSVAEVAVGQLISSTTDQYLVNLGSGAQTFYNGGTERMRIDASGNVGIGEVVPATKLEVTGSSSSGADSEIVRVTSTNTVSRILLANSSGQGGIDTNGNIIRFTHTSSNTERMRIDTGGNLLVGALLGITSSRTGVEAKNSGRLLCNAAVGTTTSVFQAWGSTGTARIMGDGDLENTNNSYGGVSDVRLKENIVDASPQLDDIMAMRVRSYTLKSTGAKHIGVVAQELEEAGMGSLVSTDEEGMKSVKYSIMYMKAIKAIQEQQAMIEELKAEVAALKGA